MAGVGEASAIIAVAQFGVNISVIVWEFAGEVRGARKEIGRLVNNIRTTSERLQEIGRLVEENPVSRLFNKEGIEGAVRCSKDCEDIIEDVTKLLVKEGRGPSLRTLEQKDLDISKLDAMLWPLLKKKLVSPQAELERVKANLMLLLYTAMARKEPNPPQSKYALEIPRLKQWAEQATRRSESMKHRTESGGSRVKIPTQREARRKDSEVQLDPELRQSFLDFQIQKAEEAEDLRLRERAAFLHAEDVKRQEAEDASRKILELNAINAYRQEQEDRDARALEREKQLEDALTEQGLEKEKIQAIMKIPCLQMPESSNANTSVSKVGLPSNTEGDHGDSSPEASPLPMKSASNSSWLYRIFSKSGKAQTTVIDETSDDDKRSNTGIRLGSVCHIESWFLDVLSGQVTEMETSQNWLDSHIKKTKQHDTLRRLAQMRHQWRTAIQDFLDRRNHKEPTNLLWKLFSISLPRRMSRVPVFGHRHSDCLVKLTICRAEDVLSQEPSTSGRTSARPQTPSSHITTKPSVASLAVPKKDHPAHESKNTSKYHNGNESGKELIETKSDLQVPPNQSTTRRKRDDWISTVEIVEKRSRDNPLQVTGFTLIPTGLISASALRELDHPFTEDTANEISMVPSILRDEELMELIRVTIAQITDGQPLSTRLPGKMVVRRPGATEGTFFKENHYEIDVDVSGVHFGKILYEGATESLIKAFEGSFARDRNRQAKDVAAGAKHAATDWWHRTPSIYIPRTPAHYVSTVPEYDVSYAGSHSGRPTTYNRNLEFKPSDHLIKYRPRGTSRERAFNRSYSPPKTRILTLDSDDEISSDDSRVYSHDGRPEALKRTYHRSRSRDRHRRADTSPDEIVIRDSHRLTGGRMRTSYHDLRDEDDIILPGRASRPNKRQESSWSNQDWDSQQGKSQQLVRFKSSPTKSRARYAFPPRRLPSKSKALGLIANDPARERSPSHPNLYHEKTNDDEEETISRTLMSYTTFNSDESPGLVASPDEADYSDLSDSGPLNETTLEQARKTLRRLVEKREKALKDGDLMTESDLKFYAIPDVEARIQQLTSQSEQGQPEQGLEDHEDESERDGRQHGPFQPEMLAHDPDRRAEEFDVPDTPLGGADRRHDDEPT